MSTVGADMQPESVETSNMDVHKLTKKQLEKYHEQELEMAKMKYEIELEKLKLDREREKEENNLKIRQMELESAEKMKLLELELAKSKSVVSDSSVSVKVKMQPFDVDRDDILTYLSEFEAVAQQAGWDDRVRVLQLRTLLPGDAREVARGSSQEYGGLKRALITRFGKRPADYFVMLDSVKRNDRETYRSLDARIRTYVERFLDDKDPVEQLCEAFFLKALPAKQAQWIRRNKGSGSVIEAAEDYTDTDFIKTKENNNYRPPEFDISDRKCFKCHRRGHSARSCPVRRPNQASYFIMEQREQNQLTYLPGQVNGKAVPFVKDTGCALTLVKAKHVPKECIIEGQYTSLQTALGEPFRAKMAIVDLTTPYYSGYAQVGVVPDLVEDALLGNDIIRRSSVNVVTRSKATAAQEEDDHSHSMSTHDGITMPDSVTLAAQQRDDESLIQLRETALSSQEEAAKFSSAFFWDNSVLYRHWTNRDGTVKGKQIVVPQNLRAKILNLAHDRPLAGHLGVEKTKQRVLRNFYWPGLFKDVSEYCRTCDTCQKSAKRRQGETAPMQVVPKTSEPFRKVSMDIVGPMARTKRGNKYILTIVDEATRYPEAYALKSTEAEVIINKLMDMFSRTGVPEVILTDQGSNFTSDLMKQLYDSLGVKGVTTSPYNPKANGVVERFNGTLKAMLKKLGNKECNNWDDLLPYVLFAYREVPHEETGFAPFELLYGWPVRGPLDIAYFMMTGEADADQTLLDHIIRIRENLANMTEVVQENLSRRHEATKKWYDERHSAKTREFKPGEQVLVLLPSSTKKMLAQWKGPFRVVRRVSEVNYLIQVGGRRGSVVYHVNLLRRYHPRAVLQVSLEQPEEESSGMLFHDDVETFHDVQMSTSLSREQKSQLKSIFEDFSDVLTSKPGRTHLMEHDIKTTSETPVTQSPYRIPHAKLSEVKSAIDSMLKQGIIRKSQSPYSSPIVLVRKPDASLRICVNYKKLNDQTIFDSFPMPRVDETIETLGQAKFLSRMDLTKGYYQIPLSTSAQMKSAFTTPFGLFEFTVMPFGMKTAPACFARLMKMVLADVSNVVAYFDDIIIYSMTWDEHLATLKEVLKCLREAGLTVRPTKCEFGCAETMVLGHVVGQGKVKPNPEKVRAMLDYPLPTTKKQLRTFLGMTSYYRKFIKDFAKLTSGLTDLLKKGSPTNLVWTDHLVTCFNSIKETLTTPPVLVNPVFSEPFILQTDASDLALGAVLSQVQHGDEHPIAYLSRKLLPREQNYSTIEKECLAMVWGVESLSYYLSGVEFIVETDHNPLVWLHKMKDKNQRLLRWSIIIQAYHFKINYKRGATNGNADGLSRI